MRYEFKKRIFRVAFVSHCCLFPHSAFFFVRGTNANVLNRSKHWFRVCPTNGEECRIMRRKRGGMDNNAKTNMTRNFVFNIRMSLFSTFVTVETGLYHLRRIYLPRHFPYKEILVMANSHSCRIPRHACRQRAWSCGLRNIRRNFGR